MKARNANARKTDEAAKISMPTEKAEHATASLREIKVVVRQVSMKDHDDEYEDRNYWLSRSPEERIAAVTRLRAQFIRPGQRLDKTHVVKRKR